MRTPTFDRALAAVMACGLTIGAALWSGTPAFAQSGTSAAKPAQGETAPKKVVLIFKNGNRVEALLLSETETSVHVKVTVAGISSETDYNKADIAEIKPVGGSEPAQPAAPRPAETAAPAETTSGALPAAAEPPAADDLSGLVEEQSVAWGDQSWRITTRAAESEPDGPKVYMIFMGGEFGRDVSFTPMMDVMRDVKKYQPDVLVCFYNHEFVHHGQQTADYAPDLGAFDQLEQARAIATLLIDDIRKNPSEWPKPPRMVSWVRKAMGGAAFLPFVAPEIYYTPDGLHGGIGYLEHIFDGVGDERAREKQYSLRQARGEGLAELGGHEKLIMRAMARTDFVLSVKFVNGEPVFLPDKMPESPDEILLTDDGKDDRRDILSDIVRGKGNDTLTLNADLAYRIGLSRGTAETIDDLMDQLGVSRNYVLIKGRGNQILREWSRRVADAELQIQRLVRQYNEVRVRPPGDYAARTRARGERKQIMLKVKALLLKYKEAINPQRIRDYPENMLTDIDWIIKQIETQQLADKPERR